MLAQRTARPPGDANAKAALVHVRRRSSARARREAEAADPTADAAEVLCDLSQPCEVTLLQFQRGMDLLLAGSWQSSDGALWEVSKLGLATKDASGSKVQVVLQVVQDPPSGSAFRLVLVKATDSWLDGYSVNTADFSLSGFTWMKPGCKDITWRKMYCWPGRPSVPHP